MSEDRVAGTRMRLPRHVGLGLVVSLCFVPGVADGQSAKEVNEQVQFWASLNSTTRVTDRRGAIAYIHVRRNDFLADPSFNLLRFGAHYWVSDKLQVSLGYTHQGTIRLRYPGSVGTDRGRDRVLAASVPRGRRAAGRNIVNKDQKGPEKLKRTAYEAELRELQTELYHLHDWVRHTGARIVVVFEGRDAAGKAGTIRALTERVSPRVFRTVALPAPSDARRPRCTCSGTWRISPLPARS